MKKSIIRLVIIALALTTVLTVLTACSSSSSASSYKADERYGIWEQYKHTKNYRIIGYSFDGELFPEDGYAILDNNGNIVAEFPGGTLEQGGICGSNGETLFVFPAD